MSPPAPTRGLPPEMRHAIVQAIQNGYKRDEKTGLAGCSLACRHWSDLIRPLLFRELVLNCPLDVERLEAILRSNVPIRTWIHSLHVEHRDDEQPWLHHVYNLVALVSGELYMHVTIDKSDVAKEAQNTAGKHPTPNIPSIFLHRSLPGSVYPIQSLALDNVHLKRPLQLVRFVLSIPTLQDCTLTRLSFSDESALLTVPPPRVYSRPRALESVSVEDCHEPGISSTQLALACLFFSSGNTWSIDADTWTQIRAAIESLAPPDGVTARCHISRLDDDGELAYLHTSLSLTERPTGQTSLWLRTDSTPAARTPRRPARHSAHLHDLPPGGGPLRLRFTLDSHTDVPALRWGALDAALQALAPPPEVAFRCSSVLVARWLLTGVLRGAVLPRAHAAHRVAVEVWGFFGGGVCVCGADIARAPRRCGEGRRAVVLSAVQRAEWLLCESEEAKVRYLDDLMNVAERIGASEDAAVGDEVGICGLAQACTC